MTKEKPRQEALTGAEEAIRNNNVWLSPAQARVLFSALHGVPQAEDDVGTRLPAGIFALAWHRADTFERFLDYNGIKLTGGSE